MKLILSNFGPLGAKIIKNYGFNLFIFIIFYKIVVRWCWRPDGEHAVTCGGACWATSSSFFQVGTQKTTLKHDFELNFLAFLNATFHNYFLFFRFQFCLRWNSRKTKLLTTDVGKSILESVLKNHRLGFDFVFLFSNVSFSSRLWKVEDEEKRGSLGMNNKMSTEPFEIWWK